MGKYYDKYKHVYKIDRVSPKRIKVSKTNNQSTIIDYDSAEECLAEYIKLHNEYKEAMSFGRDNQE